MSLAFKQTARASAIDIAVDVKLQQIGRRVSRPSGVGRSSARKAKLFEIEIINKSLDEADRVIIGDIIVDSFWEEQDMRARSAFNEAQWNLSWRLCAIICYYVE
jgi:hypothetical protein